LIKGEIIINHLQGPPYDLSGINEEEIIFKLANHFPADIYFFIWRCCEEKNELRFKFTLPIYFNSRFQMRAVINLSRLELVNTINREGPHVGIEKLVASDIRITRRGSIIFQEWIKIGFVSTILNISHDIRRDYNAFNNYFYENFKFSKELEESKIKISKIKIITYENCFFLKGPAEHKIQVCVEYRQFLTMDTLKEEVGLVSALISCGFCNENFIFTIKPKTYNKYIISKKAIKRGCPNCKYPHFRTRFLIFLYRDEFNFEKYLTNKDKDKLYSLKHKQKKKTLLRFKIFISNNVFSSLEKRLIINDFEKELDKKWDELKVEYILFDEFKDSINDFYNKQKNEIRDSLDNYL